MATGQSSAQHPGGAVTDGQKGGQQWARATALASAWHLVKGPTLLILHNTAVRSQLFAGQEQDCLSVESGAEQHVERAAFLAGGTRAFVSATLSLK